MVVIRLSRKGAKKNPFYHIQAIDKRKSKSYVPCERLGYFNPVAKGVEVRLCLNIEAVNKWLECGAQPSDRVRSLLTEFSKSKPNERGEIIENERVKMARTKPKKAPKVVAKPTSETPKPTGEKTDTESE